MSQLPFALLFSAPLLLAQDGGPSGPIAGAVSINVSVPSGPAAGPRSEKSAPAVPGVWSRESSTNRLPGGLAAEDYMRVYDVSSLNMEWAEDGLADTVLMPVIGFGKDLDDDYLGSPEVASIDTFIGMITELYKQELEYEGRVVALGSEGHLVVQGPDYLHQRISETLSFLEAVINAESVLAIDTVVLPGPGPDGALIDQAEAEAWLQGLDATVDHKRCTVRLRADRTALLDLSHHEHAVIDFDVEIAQGAAMQDPIVATVKTGTQLQLMGAPTATGTSLAFIMSRNDRLRAEPVEVMMNFWSGGEMKGLELTRSSARLSDLQVMSRSHALSTFLPRGKAIVLSNAVDVTGGSLREVVVIRHVGGGLPTRHEMKLSDGGSRLLFVDLGSISPPRATFMGRMFVGDRSQYGPLSNGLGIDVGAVISAGLDPTDLDLTKELLLTSDYPLRLEQVGRFLVSRPDFPLVEGGEQQVKIEQAKFLATFESLKPSEGVYDLELIVRSEGSEPVRTRLPLRSGSGAAAVLGVQACENHDYDVEVAQFSGVGELRRRTVLDGMCVWVRLTPTQSGDLLLQLRGGVQLAGPQETFDLGNPVLDFVHQTELETLLLDEQTVLRGEDGVWSAVFGDSMEAGLSLEVRASRVN